MPFTHNLHPFMNKTVVKFGGSNLKSSSDIQNIIDIIKSYNQAIIIVVSAFFGVTDLLHLLLKNGQSQTAQKDIIAEVFEKYETITSDYIPKSDQRLELSNELRKRKEQLKAHLEKYETHNTPIEYQNLILSFGERLSSLCLSYILKNQDILCNEALPEDIGLISNENLQNASVPLNSDFSYLQSQLNQNKTLVVPGFYAQTKSGATSVFGRGGSDYTAAILAFACHANSLDLWKDVTGFLSADPKIVTQTIKIDALTYLEAAELSYFGAKIIHPGTIRPLIKANIPLNILDVHSNSKALSSKTKINGSINISPQIIKSITYSNHFILLKLKGTGVGIKKGILSEITKAFDFAQINIRSVITSQIEIDLLIHEKDQALALKISQELQSHYFDIEIDRQISLIAAIGHGIKQSAGISGKIFGALAEQAINIKHIVFGASEVSMYLIVGKNDLKSAIQSIHDKLFNS